MVVLTASAEPDVAENSSLLKQLAHVFRQSDLWAWMAPLATSRGDSQESWGVASGLVEGRARDLALGIDAGAVDQIQGGGTRNEGIEVCHYAVLPKQRPAVEVYIAREANQLAF